MRCEIFMRIKILFIKKQRKNINRLAQTLSPIKYPVETSIKNLVPQTSIWTPNFGVRSLASLELFLDWVLNLVYDFSSLAFVIDDEMMIVLFSVNR